MLSRYISWATELLVTVGYIRRWRHLRYVSAHLHVIEIYAEGCEGLSERFISSRQPAEPLCGVRLHGIIRLRAAAHWTTELPSCSHGQTSHLRHTQPARTKSNLMSGSDDHDVRWCCQTAEAQGGSQGYRPYLWCRRISADSRAIPNTVAPAGMTRPVAEWSLSSCSPLFGTRKLLLHVFKSQYTLTGYNWLEPFARFFEVGFQLS